MEIDQKNERLMRTLVRDQDTRGNSFASRSKGLELGNVPRNRAPGREGQSGI